MEPSRDAVAFFEKEVRPLLISQCQKCHGDKKQESGLRVDSRMALLKGGESGPAIVPGKTDQGTFLSAIHHTGELKMPPSGKMPAAQLAIFTKWIADGAVWPHDTPVAGSPQVAKAHWAFQPIVKPTLPSAPPEWSTNPIDQFVYQRMLANKLKPVADADRRTLIRRVTFDLTGLPPTPQEIHDFIHDQKPDAYDRLVDRLLASSAYGERWGRHWLDVARYADTAGDGADYPVREAGQYRDWVINAFNADQPFDQFIQEQIAGDIIAKNGPPEQFAPRVTATGFWAIGKRYGYAPNPDYQHLDFADAIDSMGRSILGLSLGCARCHDHKYDPVTSADYYGLYGILQSTKWAFPGGEEMKRPVNFPPLLPPDQVAKLEQTRTAEFARIDSELAKFTIERQQLDRSLFAGGVDMAFEAQTIGKAPSGAWFAHGPNTILAEAQSPFQHVHPAGKQGVRMLAGASNDGVRMVLPNAFTKNAKKPIHLSIDLRSLASTEKTGSYRFFWGRGVIGSIAMECSISATEFHIREGGKWVLIRTLKLDEWNTLQITIDPEKKIVSGSIGKLGDLTAFTNKALNPTWDGQIDTFICDGIGHLPGKTPPHDLDNLAVSYTPFPAPGSPAAKAPEVPADLPKKLAAIDAQIATLKKERSAIAAKSVYPVTYGVSEATPVNVKIQKRGEPDKLGAEVPRRFISVLGGDIVPPNAGSGRLELANWLTRPSNPLTARVFVNRVWQWHFGRGIVPTASDFGTRGERPTHPELLDYLAHQFMTTGWSVKNLHRLIVKSKTYRLASEDHTENLKIDPNNHWHWRHTRLPLEAEAIRDAMLTVSGKLDRSPMPQHPFPPVESWGFTIHNPFHAVYDHDRRSVYLMVQRNRRHPFLALFDAADPNLSAAERLPTTTPTQTLYLMNSPFVHTQAEAFAKWIISQPGDDRQKLRDAIALAHGQDASDVELNQGLIFLKTYQQKLADRKLTPDQQALQAWAAYARVLLTSNAFLYVD